MSEITKIIDIPDWDTAITHSLFVNNIKEPKCFQDVAKVMGTALEVLLISKNEKYGKGNILSAKRFGMTVEQGLLLRENDKTERIINELKGVDLGKEGLIESFGDKTGYSAIGMMLQMKTKDGKSWYELPISKP